MRTLLEFEKPIAELEDKPSWKIRQVGRNAKLKEMPRWRICLVGRKATLEKCWITQIYVVKNEFHVEEKSIWRS